MKKLSFKKWLAEADSSAQLSTGTTTSSVAQFKMPISLGIVRRNWPYLKKQNKH
jgi:hypothetical protein